MTRLCERCARKLEGKYIVTPEGGMAVGVCTLCYQTAPTQIWEITPRVTRYVRRSGGGEREKAGRRGRG